MNIRWFSPTSAFNISYLRRLYVLGLLVVIIFSAPAAFAGAADWKVFVAGALVVTSYFGCLTRVSLLALVLVCVDVLRLAPFTNVITDYYLDLGLIFAACRSSDVLSMDGLLQARSRADKGGIDVPAASVVYAGPIRLFWIYSAAALMLARPTDPLPAFVFMGFGLISLPDWSKKVRKLGKKMFPNPLYVVYDGNCKLCRRTAAALNSIDEFGRMIYVNGMHDAELKRYSLTHLDKTRLAQDMHVVSGGQTFTGFFGYREMVKRIPVLWLTVPFLYLQPIPQIAQKIYRKIADSRACSVVPKSGSLQWIDPSVKPIDLIAPAVVAALLLIGHLFNL